MRRNSEKFPLREKVCVWHSERLSRLITAECYLCPVACQQVEIQFLLTIHKCKNNTSSQMVELKRKRLINKVIHWVIFLHLRNISLPTVLVFLLRHARFSALPLLLSCTILVPFSSSYKIPIFAMQMTNSRSMKRDRVLFFSQKLKDGQRKHLSIILIGNVHSRY